MNKDTRLDYGYANLSMDVDEILGRDFWIFDNFSALMLPAMTEPLKLSATVSIYVRKGSAKVNVNLMSYDIKAPAIVNVRAGEIMQPTEMSPDFQASFVVLSKTFVEDIFMHINDLQNLSAIARNPVTAIPQDIATKFDNLYDSLHLVTSDTQNPHLLKVLEHCLISFYYRYAYRLFDLIKPGMDASYRLCDRFLDLAQKNFKDYRFLEFYSDRLGVTTKHLSRTVRQQTGYSAAAWIDRFVILESKVLLKSSNLTIQQISDSLHFPTQSFFGKYFKKHVGMSPKAYRNG